MTATDRQQRERDDLARHLLQHYPDTLLLLAQVLGHQAAATQVVAARFTPAELLLTVTSVSSSEQEVVLPLPGGAPAPLRERVGQLVAAARQAAPGAPVTGLERVLAGHGH